VVSARLDVQQLLDAGAVPLLKPNETVTMAGLVMKESSWVIVGCVYILFFRSQPFVLRWIHVRFTITGKGNVS